MEDHAARLARKADLARQSRRRKKKHLEGIEQQIHDLEMQLADLPPCADESNDDFDVSDAPVTHSELTAMSLRIHAHCNSIGSIAECTNARKHIADMLLDELESSVEPIPLTAFYLLLLDQPDAFYSQSQGIWSTLCSEQYLDLPEELKRRLLDPEIRAVLHRDRQATLDGVARVREFRSAITAQINSVSELTRRVNEILTQPQLVALQALIDNNPTLLSSS